MSPREDSCVPEPLSFGEMDSLFPGQHGFQLDGRSDNPNYGRGFEQVLARSGRVGSSSVRENFIAYQMKTNHCRHGLPIKKKRRYRFLHILPQLVPVVGLRENAFGQALRDEASIGFLRHLEHDLIHEPSLFHEEKINKH